MKNGRSLAGELELSCGWQVGLPAKAPEGWTHSRRFARAQVVAIRASVLECAEPSGALRSSTANHEGKL